MALMRLGLYFRSICELAIDPDVVGWSEMTTWDITKDVVYETLDKGRLGHAFCVVVAPGVPR